jgi:hypothetical protein
MARNCPDSAGLSLTPPPPQLFPSGPTVHFQSAHLKGRIRFDRAGLGLIQPRVLDLELWILEFEIYAAGARRFPAAADHPPYVIYLCQRTVARLADRARGQNHAGNRSSPSPFSPDTLSLRPPPAPSNSFDITPNARLVNLRCFRPPRAIRLRSGLPAVPDGHDPRPHFTEGRN